jgi:hypothetical protein
MMGEPGHWDFGDDELAARLRHRCTYAELIAGLPGELVRYRDRPEVAGRITEILAR